MYRLCPPHRSAHEDSRCAYTTVLPRRHSLVRLALGHLYIVTPVLSLFWVFFDLYDSRLY